MTWQGVMGVDARFRRIHKEIDRTIGEIKASRLIMKLYCWDSATSRRKRHDVIRVFHPANHHPVS